MAAEANPANTLENVVASARGMRRTALGQQTACNTIIPSGVGMAEEVMRRRDFVALLGSAAASLIPRPLVARAQQPRMPVIGYLGAESPDRFASRLRAFREGLAAAGFTEGRNVAIEYRWAEGNNERLPALAAELVRRPVSVLAAPGGVTAAFAAKAATQIIPIVFETGADPVVIGLVTNLRQPGGNITGVTSLNAAVGAKRLDCCTNSFPLPKPSRCCQSRQSEKRRGDDQRLAGGGPHPWLQSSGVECQYRSRVRPGLCGIGRAEGRRAGDRQRDILRTPQ
jgi:hypothetical protein